MDALNLRCFNLWWSIKFETSNLTPREHLTHNDLPIFITIKVTIQLYDTLWSCLPAQVIINLLECAVANLLFMFSITFNQSKVAVIFSVVLQTYISTKRRRTLAANISKYLGDTNVLQYFGYMRHNLAVPHAFAKVMKVTNHGRLREAKLAWYSPSVTH